MQKFILMSFFLFVSAIQAQEKKALSADELLKDSIYSQNKKAIMNYSIKEFDALFFEFFQKKNNQKVVLTKEEFYTYTVKISIFSDRLARLYPSQKEIAAESKKKWLSESYEDYLKSKEIQKK